MKTENQVTQEFREKLQQLLNEFNADLTVETDYFMFGGGSISRMEVTIPSTWDEDGNQLREFTTIDLGQFISADIV